MRRLTTLMIAIVVGMWIGIASADSDREAYKEGLRLAKIGSYRRALKVFGELVENNTTLPGVHYNLGNIYFHIGEHAEAVRAYKAAIQIDPRDADAYYNLAMTYSVMDQMKEALVTLEEVVKIRPKDGNAHCALASGYASFKMWDKAHAHLNCAKEINHPLPPGLEAFLAKHPPTQTTQEQ
jgi:tetratricopeptide (TPR) repeat protein